MNKAQRLQALARVADVRSEAALARLRAVAQEEQRLRSALSDLSRDEQRFRATKADHPARFNGVATAWQRWSDARIIETNARLAQVLARKAPVLEAAQADVGRRVAIDKLLAQIRLGR